MSGKKKRKDTKRNAKKLRAIVDYFGFTEEEAHQIPDHQYGALVKYAFVRTKNLWHEARDERNYNKGDDLPIIRKYVPLKRDDFTEGVPISHLENCLREENQIAHLLDVYRRFDRACHKKERKQRRYDQTNN